MCRFFYVTMGVVKTINFTTFEGTDMQYFVFICTV